MRTKLGYLFLLGLILVLACGGSGSRGGLTGKWRGMVNEDDRSTLVEFDLREQGGRISGTMAVLSRTEQDIDSGMVLKITEGTLVGDSVNFVVPFDEGEIDGDALMFDFVLRGDTLDGFGYQNYSDSDRLPLTFTRY